MRVFQNKKNKEKEVIEETKAVEKAVETTKPVESTTPTEEKKTTTTKNTKKMPKSVCRVIVATPSYFVINKDGETITIKKKNTYHKGEEIYY